MARGAYLVWLRILRWRDYPGLSEQTWYNHMGPDKTETEGDREGDWTKELLSESETRRGCHLWRWKEPWASVCQWTHQGNGFCFRASTKAWLCQCLDVSPGGPTLDFRPLDLEDSSLCCFKPRRSWLLLHRQWETNTFTYELRLQQELCLPGVSAWLLCRRHGVCIWQANCVKEWETLAFFWETAGSYRLNGAAQQETEK